MEEDFESIANKILQIDDVMRQVGLVNDKGELVNTMMKEGKTPQLENKKLAKISHDLYVIKSIHDTIEEVLGEFNLVHWSTKKVYVLIFYVMDRLVYVTCDGNTSEYKIADISIKIKAIIESLRN